MKVFSFFLICLGFFFFGFLGIEEKFCKIIFVLNSLEFFKKKILISNYYDNLFLLNIVLVFVLLVGELL